MTDFDDWWVVSNLTGEMTSCIKDVVEQARKCSHCERGMIGEPYHFFNDYCAICAQRVVLYLKREGFPECEQRLGATWFCNTSGIRQEISASLNILRELSNVCYDVPGFREYFRNFGQFLKNGDGITVASVLADFSSDEDEPSENYGSSWISSFCVCSPFKSASLLPPE